MFWFSFMIWALTIWGLSFLVADAHIFGCDASTYINPGTRPLPRGIFPLRQKLLSRFNFFRELFHCYFCMGFWCGPVAMVLLDQTSLQPWLSVEVTWQGTLCRYAVAAMVGATSGYLLNLLAEKLEA